MTNLALLRTRQSTPLAPPRSPENRGSVASGTGAALSPSASFRAEPAERLCSASRSNDNRSQLKLCRREGADASAVWNRSVPAKLAQCRAGDADRRARWKHLQPSEIISPGSGGSDRLFSDFPPARSGCTMPGPPRRSLVSRFYPALFGDCAPLLNAGRHADACASSSQNLLTNTLQLFRTASSIKA